MCNCTAVHTSADLDAPDGNEKHDDQPGSTKDEWVDCTSSNYVATFEVYWLGSGLSLIVQGESNVWATYTEWTPQSSNTPAVDRYVT